MFTMNYETVLGDKARFKICQFNRAKFIRDWTLIYGSPPETLDERESICVVDTTDVDEHGLPKNVYFAWCEDINSFADIVNTLRPKYPESFTFLQSFLDSRLAVFQERYGNGKFPTQDVVDKWINKFYTA